MRAVRLRTPEGAAGLVLEELDTPAPGAGEVLVRVHAAAITRNELDWPVDRLPATPSYELSGVVAALGPDVDGFQVGEAVYALTGFDRDGAAADYAVVPGAFLAPKPGTLGHVVSAAIPLAALSAWQGLFDHGRLAGGQRVLVHGAAGGVGGFAVQLAHWRGAVVIGTARPPMSRPPASLGPTRSSIMLRPALRILSSPSTWFLTPPEGTGSSARRRWCARAAGWCRSPASRQRRPRRDAASPRCTLWSSRTASSSSSWPGWPIAAICG